MRRIKAVCTVLGFALVALALLPLVVFDFNAAVEEEFPSVMVFNGGGYTQYITASQTVAELLVERNITLGEFDRINYPKAFPIHEDMVLRVVRGVPFYVATDSGVSRRRVVTGGTTVEEILLELQAYYGIAFLYDNDVTREIEYMDSLEFLSWRNRTFFTTEAIPFETIENRTGAIRYGRTYLRQRGTVGEREAWTNVVYIGGYEASRTIFDEVILSEPTVTIYDVGTGRLGELADTSAPEFRYLRRIRMQATAYCACFICTGRNPTDAAFGITASGRRVEHGIVAVDRTVIALGTHLYVAGYGFALAADVGGAIRGYRIDLFMYSHQDALQFGRRYIYVYVLR